MEFDSNNNGTKEPKETEIEISNPKRQGSSKLRYNSPLVQIAVLGMVCFCCPGMFNALNGLGAGGKADSKITDNANTALSVTFAVFSLLAGAVFNVLGHRLTLFIGGLTYVLYVGSYLSYAAAFVIIAGAVLGIGGGFLWAAQGAIMISYPEEHQKGRFIGIFWSIFNLGGALGSLIPLIIEWNTGKSSVSVPTYVAFMVIMACGTCLSLALLPPQKVVRNGGEPVAMHHYSSLLLEAVEILKLFMDWRMLMMAPMFFASNWFYTYQFNAVNAGGEFTTRTRAFNGTFYWFCQILGANLMGNFLDSTWLSKSRRKRGEIGLAVLLICSTAIWTGGYEFQRTFTRESAQAIPEELKMDLRETSRYVGPVILYACYGFFDAIWQTYCYWIMGALTNDTRKAARFSGFYKAVQNAGAALAGQVDAQKVSFMHELLITWALLSYGCISAAFVAHYAVKDSNENLGGKMPAGSSPEASKQFDIPATKPSNRIETNMSDSPYASKQVDAQAMNLDEHVNQNGSQDA